MIVAKEYGLITAVEELAYGCEYGKCRVKEVSGYGDKWPPLSPFKYGLMPLRRGSRGDNVKLLQSMLNRIGYSLAVDGIFGPKTEAAVIAFQRSRGLTPDGWVGRYTWQELEKAVAEATARVTPPTTPTMPQAPGPAPEGMMRKILPIALIGTLAIGVILLLRQ